MVCESQSERKILKICGTTEMLCIYRCRASESTGGEISVFKVLDNVGEEHTVNKTGQSRLSLLVYL